MPLRLPRRLLLAAVTASVAAATVAGAAQAASPSHAPRSAAVVQPPATSTVARSTPRPGIVGTPTPGARLHVVTGRWPGGRVHLHVRWLRNGRPIAGATRGVYLVRPADRGDRLSVSVRGTRHGLLLGTVRSAAVRVPAPTGSAPRSSVPVPVPVPVSSSPTPTASRTVAAAPAAPSAGAAPIAAPTSSTPTASTPTSSPAPTAPAAGAATAPAADGRISGDGDLLVGVDVLPGLYVTAGRPSNCSWKAVSAFDRAPASTLRHDFGAGQRVLQVLPGDHGVTLSGCGPWIRAADAGVETEVASGVHVVGPQVPAGTYQAAVPPDGCFWALLSAFDSASGSIIRQGYATPSGGTATLVVPADAAGFMTSGCGPWSRTD